MNKKLFTPKSILCMILIVLYFAGLVSMMLGASSVGMLLWTISILGSLAFLYIERRKREQEAELKRIQNQGKPEDDKSCE